MGGLLQFIKIIYISIFVIIAMAMTACDEDVANSTEEDAALSETIDDSSSSGTTDSSSSSSSDSSSTSSSSDSTGDGDRSLTCDSISVSPLKEISSLAFGPSRPANFTVVGKQLFFSVDDGTNGNEVWVTDGTRGGTQMVADLMNNGGSGSDNFEAMGGKLYFSADDGTDGNELFVSDGSSAGTKRILNINNGGGAFPKNLTAVGSKLFFSANDGSGVKLWVTDGTEEKTTTVKYRTDEMQSAVELSVNENAMFPVVLKDKLYFVGNDGSSASTIWYTDGTERGTGILEPTNGGSMISPRDLVASKNKMFFNANDGIHSGELWFSDGTTANTYMVMDINTSRTSRPEQIKIIGGKAYFEATHSRRDKSLWVSDGVKVDDPNADNLGTYMLQNLGNADIYHIVPLGGNIYFSTNSANRGIELWMTDLSDNTTDRLFNLESDPLVNLLSGGEVVVLNKTMYFVGDTTDNGRELWMSDGTKEGTHMVLDLNEGAADSALSAFKIVNGKTLYFAGPSINVDLQSQSVTYDANKTGLWRVDCDD